jgi:hypothetical protein
MAMTTHTEKPAQTTAATWDDETDGRFFAIVAALFSPRFTEGASALLMSYDA